VVLMIGVVSATAIVSCGGGGGGDTNGDLCQQCGDSDGPCNANGNSVSGDDRPEGCTTDPCTVQLQCVRKVDSGQRRCYPINPTTKSLDLFYKCDGSRPALVPTSTPVPTVTVTPSVTATPVDTGPTPTSVTPTATGGTPASTPTPAVEEVDVDITIETDGDSDLPTPFSATITYPPAKGSFKNGATTNCEPDDDGVTVNDDGNGTLALAFAGDNTDLTSVGIACTFHQIAGQTLTDADLNIASKDPSTLPIVIEELP
jgi:hypothetical protein